MEKDVRTQIRGAPPKEDKVGGKQKKNRVETPNKNVNLNQRVKKHVKWMRTMQIRDLSTSHL